MPQFKTPTKGPDISVLLYSSSYNYPAPYPWNPNLQTFGAPNDNVFFGSFGGASPSAYMWRQGITDVWDGYFYFMQNHSFVRTHFTVTNALGGTGQLGVFYNPTAQKLIAGFYTLSGTTIHAQIFESVETFTLSDGELPDVTMVEVFNASWNGVMSSASLTTTDVWMLVLPVGGSFQFGVCYRYLATAGGWVHTFYDCVNPALYCIGSSHGDGGELPEITAASSISHVTGDIYHAFAFIQGTGSQKIGVGNFTMLTNDTTTQILTFLNLSVSDYNQMSLQFFYNSTDGFIYAINTATTPFSLFKFDFAADNYWQVFFNAADNAAQTFLNAAHLTTPFWAYSAENNVSLFTGGKSDAPLYFTTNPFITRLIMGPGPKLPILNLACQNFCLPMYRMKKL